MRGLAECAELLGRKIGGVLDLQIYDFQIYAWQIYDLQIYDWRLYETWAVDLARPAPPPTGAGGGFSRVAHSAGPGKKSIKIVGTKMEAS